MIWLFFERDWFAACLEWYLIEKDEKLSVTGRGHGPKGHCPHSCTVHLIFTNRIPTFVICKLVFIHHGVESVISVVPRESCANNKQSHNDAHTDKKMF